MLAWRKRRESTTQVDHVDWRQLLYFVLAATLSFFPLALFSSDPNFNLYVLLVVPVVVLALLILVITYAVRWKLLWLLWSLAILAAFLLVSLVLTAMDVEIRTAERWLLWSHRYKAEVFAAPRPRSGELRHVHWDGWGFSFAGDTDVYLVFDPGDSLAFAAKHNLTGKVSGVPCEVDDVHRLEKDWYAVQLYTDETWDDCNGG
jgi:hypothetical protein